MLGAVRTHWERNSFLPGIYDLSRQDRQRMREETRAQRGEVTYPSSQSSSVAELLFTRSHCNLFYAPRILLYLFACISQMAFWFTEQSYLPGLKGIVYPVCFLSLYKRNASLSWQAYLLQLLLADFTVFTL